MDEKSPDAAPSVNPFQAPNADLGSPPKSRRRSLAGWAPTPAEFMALAVTMFVVLVVSRRHAGSSEIFTPGVLAHQLFLGLTLSALPLLFLRYRSGQLHRQAPGDWLWAACAAEQCVFLLADLGRRNGIFASWPYPWALVVIFLGVAASYAILIVFGKYFWWRAIGLCITLWYVYTSFAVFAFDDFVFRNYRGLSLILAVLALLVAVVNDQLEARRFRWSHWCGVFVFVAWIGLQYWPFVRWLTQGAG